MQDLPDKYLPRPAPRITDADRELAVTRLQNAAGDGSLDLSELEDRLDAVYSVKTRDDLDALTADLPGADLPAVPDIDLKTKHGSLKKVGYWKVPARINASCATGSIKLDFTQAECHVREVVVTVSARSGSVVIVVPHGWAVDLDSASSSSGSVVNKVRERPQPGAPVLRVSGTVSSGSIKARYPHRSFAVWLSDVLSRFRST